MPTKIHLTESLRAWGQPGFAAVLKDELRGVDPGAFPLAAAMTASSVMLDRPLEFMYLGADAHPDVLTVRVGIFFTGILAGCACADDPTPVNENNEYCEVELRIDRRTGAATAATLRDR